MASTVGTGTLGAGGAVLKASGGTVYVLFASATTLTMAKYSGGSWTTVTQTANGTVFSGNYSITICHAAIDSGNTIHVVAAASSSAGTRDVSYATYDTGTDTFSSWAQAAAFTDAAPAIACASIAIDSSDKPHVLFGNGVTNMGQTYSRIYYTNRVSGSWLTPEMVNTGTTAHYYSCQILVRGSDIIEAHYGQGPFYYRTRTSGTWGSESNYNITGGTYPASGPMLATTGGTVYRYQRNSNNIHENGTDTGVDIQLNTNAPFVQAWPVLVDSTRYLIYGEVTNFDVKVVSNSGAGWSSATTLQTGSYFRVVAGWQYNANNWGTSEIGYIFDDNSSIYYDVYALSGGAQSVNVNALAGAGSAPSGSVVAGAVTVAVQAAAAVSSAPNGSVTNTPPASTVAVQPLAAASVAASSSVSAAVAIAVQVAGGAALAPTGSVAASVTVDVQAASAAASAPNGSVTNQAPGATVAVQALAAAASAETGAVSAGGVSIAASALTGAASAPASSIGAAVTVAAQTAAGAASAPNGAVTAGGVVVDAQVASATAEAQTITVTHGAVVVGVDALTGAAVAPNGSVGAAGASVAVHAMTAAAEGTAATVETSVTVAVQAMAASAAAAVSVEAGGEAQVVTVQPLALTAAAAGAVLPGAYTITAHEFALAATAANGSVTPGGASVGVQPLALSAEAATASVAHGAVAVAMQPFTAAAQASGSVTAIVAVTVQPLTGAGLAPAGQVAPGAVSVGAQVLTAAARLEAMSLPEFTAVAVGTLTGGASMVALLIEALIVARYRVQSGLAAAGVTGPAAAFVVQSQEDGASALAPSAAVVVR